MADAAAAPAPAPAQAPSSSSAIRTTATTADRWPALESNAEVMTDFLQRLTTTSSSSASTTTPTAPFTFADVFSLDEDCLAFVPQPVHALLLAYASDAIKDKASSDGAAAGAGSSKPVFIRQLPALDAACGTVALLHAAANAPELRAATPADSLLGRFLAGSGDAATPEAWGERLDGDDALRAAHCACASAGATEEVHGDAVVYHFVCFLPTGDDAVLELDGLKPLPVLHTGVAGAGFLERAVGVIKGQFLSKFADPEATEMSVLALTSGAGDD